MIYVAHRIRDSPDKLGLPAYIYATFTEEFNEKKPLKALNARNWRRYNCHKDGVPPPEPFRLPDKLFMVCKGLRRFEADFYTQPPTEWVVSGYWYSFFCNGDVITAMEEDRFLRFDFYTLKAGVQEQIEWIKRFLRP